LSIVISLANTSGAHTMNTFIREHELHCIGLRSSMSRTRLINAPNYIYIYISVHSFTARALTSNFCFKNIRTSPRRLCSHPRQLVNQSINLFVQRTGQKGPWGTDNGPKYIKKRIKHTYI